MKNIASSLLILMCLSILLISCKKSDESIDKINVDDSNGFISAKFNGKSKDFKFVTSGKFGNDNELLHINGFLEDNSLSPTLELILKKTEGKITPGTYYLDVDPDQNVYARYTIGRLEDGALVTNTTYEPRDIGNKNDLIITITSLTDGRAKGTFSGVITTDEEVKGDQLITLTDGKFDVHLE